LKGGEKNIKMKGYEQYAWWLVLIGAINWGLVGLGYWLGGANWNIVHMILGTWPVVENVVYLLVGLSGLWLLWGKMGK